ncbi:MAG: SLBB domain-containing protein, partial [Pelomonas sp.]|nr:SLBB domain-containing protein [Burkholderiaceae bacterium]MBV8604295.1 SLBB domain-containing protein [Roseateles sp.]
VVFIGPIGPQVALIGSVNKPAIFELKPGESVNDVVAMAGGFSAVADRSHLTVEHIRDRDDQRVMQLALPSAGADKPENGDLLRAFSAVSAVLPLDKQNVRVRVEGEVRRPGEYILPAQTTMAAAIAAAGGLTPAAYIYGTDFSRESVRAVQQQNYERALRDLETQFTRSTATQRATSADDAAALAAQSQNTTRLIAQLRSVHPSGRIVLQMDPTRPELPNLPLESGDRILVPARPTTVGVFGSVFNSGSFLYTAESSVADAIKLAGGPTRGADPGSAFVIHANGSVVSARQRSAGWLSYGSTLEGVAAQPGDTVFVPEELNKTTFMQDAKDWTTILYQFGLGAAALKTIKQ